MAGIPTELVITGKVLDFGTDRAAADLAADAIWAEYNAEEVASRGLSSPQLDDREWLTTGYFAPELYRGRWVVRVDSRVEVMHGLSVDLPTVAKLEGARDRMARAKLAVGLGTTRPRAVTVDTSGKVDAGTIPRVA